MTEPVPDRNLSDRIADLLARQDIESVLVDYCRAVDRHDLDLLLSVYHEDAIDHRVEALPAHEWASSFLPARSAQGTRSTHMLTNVSVVVDGTTAHSESYVLAVQHDPSDGSDVDLLAYGGRYLDAWERRSRWAITHRRVVHEWHTLTTMRQLPWLAGLAQGSPVASDLSTQHLSSRRP